MSTRELVLRALIAAGEGISGGEIARNLNISRNAVWKAIEQLRGEGYRIEASPGSGYIMAGEQNIISQPQIEAHLMPGSIEWKLEIHSHIDSTNNRGKELALAGAEHGTVVIADSQSAGRGRFGRKFHSPEGCGVYLSIVFRPDFGAEKAVMITSMAAVAVARAIEAVADVEARIKWVNDVYIGSKKACGILCEAGLDFESGQMQYVVAGIGVNVGFIDFPDEIKNIATSISNECGKAVSRNRFIAELLNQISILYPQIESGIFMDESRRRSNVIGRDIYVLRGDEKYAAKAVDIDDGGSLIVVTESGERQLLHSGEVSLRFE